MSEYFISKKSSSELEEISVFHIPESDGVPGIILPERVIRAQGRLGLSSLLSKWEGALLDITEQPLDSVESVEPISPEGVLSELTDFMTSHVPTEPLELASELPESLRVMLGEKVEDHLKTIAVELGLVVPDDTADDGPALYTGQYL